MLPFSVLSDYQEKSCLFYLWWLVFCICLFQVFILASYYQFEKFMELCSSYVGLSFMLLCTLFMCALMFCGLIFAFSNMIKMSSTYRTQNMQIICNTCHKAYVGQTSRDLNSRFRENVRYIKNNDPRSAYALRILNCRHEYGNINDTMTLPKQTNKPNLLLPYEQIYIQSLYLNNEIIPEQHPK